MLGRVDGDLQIARGGFEGPDAEAVARHRAGRVHLKGEAVHVGRQRAHAGGVAVAQAHDAEATGFHAHLVVGSDQRLRVAHHGAHLTGAAVGRRCDALGGCGRHEEVLARVAIEVHAQGMLLIHQTGRGQGDAPELVGRRGQVVVEEAHHAGQLATGQRAIGQRRTHAALHEVDADARVVHGIGLRGQLGGLRAQHQRLAAAHEDVDRTGLAGHGGDLDAPAEFGQQLIALVEQVVGRVRGARGLDDALVDLGQVLREAVDVVGDGLHLLLRGVAQQVELARAVAQAAGEFVGPRDDDQARRGVARRRGEVGPGVEHVVERHAQPLLARGEHGLELLQAGQARGVGRGHRAGLTRLAREVLVVGALHRGHLHALAEIAATGELITRAGQHHVLARIARRVDVGDVVADDLQRREVGIERAGGDVQRGHVWCSLSLVPAAGSASC